MGFDSKTEMLWLCASESANTLDPTLLILPSEHSCGSEVLGFQILAGFTGRTLRKKNVYLEMELYVKEINIMPSMYISGRPESIFMPSPAFYFAGVLEKIRMVLSLPTEICRTSKPCSCSATSKRDDTCILTRFLCFLKLNLRMAW
jgi:hypothetical protein